MKAKTSRDETSGSKAKWAVGLLLLLFLAIAAWFLFFRQSMAAQVAAIRAKMEVEGLSRDQRREIMSQASPDVRQAMFAAFDLERQERERKMLNEFFAMSKPQQIAELDKELDKMQRWRKAREDRAKQNAANGKQASASGRGSGNGGSGNAGGGGPGGGRGGFGGGSRDPIDRRDRYLARTTPEQRAQSNEYRRMMQQRGHQRGF